MANVTLPVSEALAGIVGDAHVLTGDAIGEDYTHDEALTATPVTPMCVVRPADAAQVAAIVNVARESRTPLTARGSGTGMCGACIPDPDGILLSFERMNAIVEIDTAEHIAVVQPGVTLDQLDIATAEVGLVYPVFPGENSASLGGNVATNAGGLRAIKYGVTRNHVLGLEAVLGTGETIRTGGRFVKSTSGYDLTQLIIGSEGTLAVVTEAILKLYPRAGHAATLLAPFRTGGRFVKSTSGYDLTQLIIGSEGTLAVVTEAILKLYPRAGHAATLLAPFRTLDEITTAVPVIVGSGIDPLILEYIDLVSMAGILRNADLDLGIPDEIKDNALAYLIVVLENQRADRLDEDIERAGELVSELGALDVYVLPSVAGTRLIDARERAFWAAKEAGANDIVDMVVPRSQIGPYMKQISAIAEETGSWIVGCGHVGDGNVHLSVFQGDPEKLTSVMRAIFAAGAAVGGAVSGEHGIGREKKKYLLEFEDPAKIALQQRIKEAFDPAGILNPGAIF